MCLCVCDCVYACVHVCMFCMCVHVCLCTHVCVCVWGAGGGGGGGGAMHIYALGQVLSLVLMEASVGGVCVCVDPQLVIYHTQRPDINPSPPQTTLPHRSSLWLTRCLL